MTDENYIRNGVLALYTTIFLLSFAYTGYVSTKERNKQENNTCSRYLYNKVEAAKACIADENCKATSIDYETILKYSESVRVLKCKEEVE